MTEEWSEKVTVVHHMPDSGDYEGGFEALTLSGVPHNVSVTGSDSESGEGALNHLLDGLRVFGFHGRVAVEDMTYIGSVQRYKVQTN